MMTASEAYAEEVGYKDEHDLCATLNVFCAGWRAADKHPNWIPVEEELPPPHYEGANSTDFVLAYDGYDVMFGYYDFEQKNWHGEDYKEVMFKITHWMPLPSIENIKKK